MAVSAAQVVVATSATALNSPDTDTVGGTTLIITNGAAAIALGASGVTTGTGFTLAANAGPIAMQLGPGEQLFAICGTTSTVQVLRLGA